MRLGVEYERIERCMSWITMAKRMMSVLERQVLEHAAYRGFNKDLRRSYE